MGKYLYLNFIFVGALFSFVVNRSQAESTVATDSTVTAKSMESLAEPSSSIPVYPEWQEVPKPGEFYMVMVKNTNKLIVKSLTVPDKVFKTYHAISGTNSGDKEREGDKKTPEGIYFIERRIPNSRLQSLHGAAAFELNYPNPVDKIIQRTGSGIWIHGVDNEDRLGRRFDTLGCIAVSNADIVDIGEKLSMKNTPIVVVDEEKSDNPIGIETMDGTIYKRVLDWAAAWSSREMEPYMIFYDSSFRSRGMNWNAWRSYKNGLAKTYKSISVTIQDLKILRHGKYSVAVFKQEYESDRFASSSLKRLYLVGSGEEARIMAEEVAQETNQRLSSMQISVGSF